MIVLYILIAGLLFYTFIMVNRLPESRPDTFIKSQPTDEITVLNIGDSITHGAMSANYVRRLEERFSEDDYRFINAGINAELVWNVLQRMDGIVACDPDYITILIGSNDVLATLSDSRMKRYMKNQGIPQKADSQWFEDNLKSLILTLKSKTNAEIAVLSLPPVTEDPSHQGYISAASYSGIVKKIAKETDIIYLPLHEVMDRILYEKAQRRKRGIPFASNNIAINVASVKRYVLRKSWDDISEKNGLTLLTDNIHLNDSAAEIIAGLIGDFLISHPPSAH
ncbi:MULTISPECIES: GDSL-type esterase/lipase family protein [unclassified Oceanispirochaeta]|uniref:SGNH/GDSL hydrolase family protein n=1 Tax=unclassified Oceanispirochaeta TaxID=2635722 RepID=UPI000E0939D8|nr:MULTISPECIES: GDSL-type esterase/lipase family protein [unclassified Oceanispirochaeta]MBF9017482.1 SGNH/GDSL hydrolase family protein [Oceanispirochaeta sp. M2]NPD74054.1 SGNH/GDSL hydrolase family protein [Oceanispirochaeta sp. M1]RDG30096.1 SGNH/GDSL hydrolase family protein [Oceanispirochaeta sp. M1]